METDSIALFDDSLWNFDGEWDSVPTNRVREWYQIKNVLRINKGKPKDHEFYLSLNLNICKPKSCIRKRFEKVDIKDSNSLTKRNKWYYQSTPLTDLIHWDNRDIKVERKQRKEKLTATKVDDNLREVHSKTKRNQIKSESPMKKKLKKIHIEDIKNLDSTKIILKLQELDKI